MGRPTYVCATCSEHFTRKYSANRHNHTLHNGAGEIVRLIDYLAGRSTGQYTANNPFWYKRSNPYNKIGSATVADSAFEPTYLRQQAPLGISQCPPSAIYRPLPTIDEQRYGSGLSQDAIQKIHKLKLMNNYHIPDEIIRLAMFNSINGDNNLLDQMLDVAARYGTAL
jgi:hypothetical protein